MKLRTRIFMQLTALLLVLGISAFAADDAYLYIVHGIPGRDKIGRASCRERV